LLSASPISLSLRQRVAEKAIALIINDEFEAAEELARLLLVLSMIIVSLHVYTCQ